MIKEVKYLVFTIIIILFILFTTKYYFSDSHKKKTFRSLTSINNKIDLYSKSLPVLVNNTKNVIEYVKNTQSIKKKKYYFWELIDRND